MSDTDALSAFTKAFILPGLRERFLHEAIKKPKKVHERICHDIESLFDAVYRDGRISLSDTERCLVYSGNVAERVTWQVASKYVGGGVGVLVIAENGRGFVAESESVKGHPAVLYAGAV